MEHDATFRLVLIAGFAVMLPIGLFHRIRAARASAEPLDRRAEGTFILLTLRPIALLATLGLLAYLINPAWMRWAALPLPLWIRWLGAAIGVAGAGLFIVTLRSLGTNLTDTVVTRSHHTLVTSGPYRWVRHPFYLAAALAVIANTLVTANWMLGLLGLTIVALLGIRTDTEEQKLIDRFGDDYRAYMTRTGRFLPRWR